MVLNYGRCDGIWVLISSSFASWLLKEGVRHVEQVHFVVVVNRDVVFVFLSFFGPVSEPSLRYLGSLRSFLHNREVRYHLQVFAYDARLGCSLWLSFSHINYIWGTFPNPKIRTVKDYLLIRTPPAPLFSYLGRIYRRWEYKWPICTLVFRHYYKILDFEKSLFLYRELLSLNKSVRKNWKENTFCEYWFKFEQIQKTFHVRVPKHIDLLYVYLKGFIAIIFQQW